MKDMLEALRLTADEYTGLAGIAEEELKVAAKRSRHAWNCYMNGIGTADAAERAIRAVSDARRAAFEAALASDGASLMLLAELEKDRIARQDERDALEAAPKEPR